MSGHSSVEMTSHYTHIGLDAKRTAIEGAEPLPESDAASRPSDVSTDGAAALEKLKALRVLLKGKVPDELLALL